MNGLPEGWADATLADVGEWASGGTPNSKRADYYGGEIPWVRTGDLRDIELHDVAGRITEAGLANSAAKVFPAGTLLVAMYGATIGRTGLLRIPAATNQACAALLPTPPTDELIPFLWWYFRGKIDDFRAIGQGGAQPNISQTVIKSQRIEVPPLAEQRRIVAKLDRLSAKRSAAEGHLARISKLAARAKQSILAAAFRGDLTAEWRAAGHSLGWTEVEVADIEGRRTAYEQSRRGSRLASDSGLTLSDLGDIPNDWFRAHLAEIVDLQVGYAFKSSWYSDEGPLLLRGANIAPGKIDWQDAKRLDPGKVEEFAVYRLNRGDIVLAMDRPLISTGLKIAVVDDSSTGSLLVQRVARITGGDHASAPFLEQFLNSRIFLDHAIGRATGGDLPHISANDILTTPVPLPPMDEQSEIVRRIEAAFARIDRLTEEASRASHLLARLDERLLAKAFRGELVSQDPTDEPASALLNRIRTEREATRLPKRGRRKKIES